MSAAIMVVEDERIIAFNLSEMLQGLGYRVAGVAAGGEEALALAEQAQPDLVLMDIRLAGGMDGVETAQRLRRLCPAPVVYLTAHSENSTLDRARATNPYGYLLKPISERALHATIQMALERRQTDIALERSEERLRLALEVAGLGPWELDRARQEIYLGERTRAILGVSGDAAQLPWHSFLDCVGSTDRERVADALLRALDDSDTASVEFLQHQDDERPRWIRAHGRRYAAPQSPQGRVIGVVQDVTGSRQVEFALRESEARFRAIFDRAGVGMAQVGHDGRWLGVNDRLCAITGYTRDEMLDQSMHQMGSSDDAEAERANIARMLAGDIESFASEQPCRRKDGSVLWILVTLSLIRDSLGAPLYFIAVIEDIDRRRRAEDEIRALVEERTLALSIAKESAEAANRAKTNFLANMSHELRTPLNVIMGMTEMALRRAVDPRQADQLRKAAQASRQLMALIADLLDVTKIESERLTIESVEFVPDQVLQNPLRVLAEKAAEKRLDWRIDVDPELGARRFLGDPRRLEQVLLNLIDNAVKFTDHGWVAVRAREVRDSGNAATLRFEVADSGIGIAQEDQIRLFNAFEKADDSMTRRFGGTGLGLAISRRLARMMDGDVTVKSAPGAGSTFTLTVRLQSVQAEVLPDLPLDDRVVLERLRNDYAGARVLLVEDEILNREIAFEILEDVGLRVEMAEDGEQALDMAQRRGYDLVLMDVRMPRLNGLEATRMLRTLPAFAHTPIVAMTANAFAEDRDRCLEAGMDDFIAKPFPPESLLATVLTWLDRTRAARNGRTAG
ncbi:MAG: response regulator [Rhodocyclaceae bacterium]|nr:response regulator [Rhodocyclaceae bacterium]